MHIPFSVCAKLEVLFFLCFSLFPASGQQGKNGTIQVLSTGEGISLRGLSVVSDKIIWVSGSGGTVGKTEDGGKTWQWTIADDRKNTDFRDIEAFDENTALIMGIDAPGLLLRTTDGGITWKTVLVDSTKGMFLDAMAFKGNKGIIIGDPVNGKIYTAQTTDSGKSWKPSAIFTHPEEGEAFFAASGTNIAWDDRGHILAVSGGKTARLLTGDTAFVLPLLQGKESTGANSIALVPASGKAGSIAAVIAGGDFLEKDSSRGNCVLLLRVKNKRQKPVFIFPEKGPKGYKSCVAYIGNHRLMATGTSGTDISYDEGRHWQHLSDEAFHACGSAANGRLVYLAGPGGKIAVWQDDK